MTTTSGEGASARARLVLGGLGVLGLGVVGFLPLFGDLGYESALAAGLLLPVAAASSAAVAVVARRPAPLAALGTGALTGLAIGAGGCLVVLLHALRTGPCDWLGGLAFYWLGGGMGALAGGLWGAVAATVATLDARCRRTTAILLALAGPAAGIGVSLARFYFTPMVFAFDPFFGYFAGPVYDTVVEGMGRLALYRVGTGLAFLAAIGVALRLERREGRVALVRTPGAGGLGLGLALLGGLGAFAHAGLGGELRHWANGTTLARDLGGHREGSRCQLLYSRTIPTARAELLLRECEAHLPELEQYLGVAGPDQVRVYLFASAAEKGQLTGAYRTQIAKPWRAEIYLNDAPYPHPVLRHELAHVVASAMGRGPFRVAGSCWGLIPDPGRIEGLAEAAAPDEEGELTSMQWARAMRDLGQLPPLQQIFRLDFFGHGAAKAYTVAGAFISWLVEARGVEVLRRWYAGEPLAQITGGEDLGALEVAWHRALDAVGVPAAALPSARARFERPAIFGRRCPRVVDRLEAEAATALASGRVEAARVHFRALLAFDPGHLRARSGLGTCALREGDRAGARALLQAAVSDLGLTVHARGVLHEHRGDLALLLGDLPQARAAYADAMATVSAMSARHRTLEVKAMLSDDALARAAIVELLIGSVERGPDFGLAAAHLGEWAATRPQDGTPLYLLGRNLYFRGHWVESARYLDRALARSFPRPSLLEEAWRVRLLVACALGDLASARRARTVYSSLPGPSPALCAGTLAIARRCGAS